MSNVKVLFPYPVLLFFWKNIMNRSVSLMTTLLTAAVLSMGVAHANTATTSTTAASTTASTQSPVAKVVSAVKHALVKPKAHVAAKPAVDVKTKTTAPTAQ
jgi:hypothetical protein